MDYYIFYIIFIKKIYSNDISSIKSTFITCSSHFYKGALEIFKSIKNATTTFPNNTTNIERYLSVTPQNPGVC